MAESAASKHLAQILGEISQFIENHPRFTTPENNWDQTTVSVGSTA